MFPRIFRGAPPSRHRLPRFNSIEAQEHHRILVDLDNYPEKFINFDHPPHADMFVFLHSVSLQNAWSLEKRCPYYPHLVRDFYANLSTIQDEQHNQVLITRVLGRNLHITNEDIKEILGIPEEYTQSIIFEMTDPTILPRLGPHFRVGMDIAQLPPIAQTLVRLFARNLIPTHDPLTNLSYKLAHCIYAVYAGMYINWGAVLIDSMLRTMTTRLYHPCLITMIMRHFGLPIDDQFSILDLGFFYDEPTEPTPPSHSQPADNSDPPVSPDHRSPPQPTSSTPLIQMYPHSSSSRNSTDLATQLIAFRAEFAEFRNEMREHLVDIHDTQSSIFWRLEGRPRPPPR